MSLRKLASIIAKREGKKVPVSIGNIREVLRILADIEAEYVVDIDSHRLHSPSNMLAREGCQAKRARAARRRLGLK